MLPAVIPNCLRNGAEKEVSDEGKSRSETIAKGAGKEADNKSRG